MNEWFYVHGFSSPFQFQSPSISLFNFSPLTFFKLGFFLHFYFFFFSFSWPFPLFEHMPDLYRRGLLPL